MTSHFPDPDPLPDQTHQSPAEHYASLALAIITLIYGLLAGLHTLQDFDLGWQLATGRWVLQHHHVFSADVFSYTAFGQPWIYPVLSGVIFYACFLAGGYTLLSWIGATASAGTMALLVRKDSFAVSILALIAVPLIAIRTQPRAEMFTTILFAAFLALLWKYYRTGRARLWLLPILMVLWVNLHLGFVSGLALCFAYVLLEMLHLFFVPRRHAAIERLRRAWPLLALTVLCTLVNPWGPFLYRALFRQQSAQSFHNLWIVEWQGVYPSWSSLRQAIDWRGPQSSFWWLIAVALGGICIAVWRKQQGAAILLAGSAYLAIRHVRLQALFACVVVVVAGSLIEELRIRSEKTTSSARSKFRRLQIVGTFFLSVVLALVAVVRSSDLISNRYYMRSAQLCLFGTGLSWWYPERAVDLLQREKLPAQVFNEYNLGGYLIWRLLPEYHDYIDSRALPFGPELFFRAYDLSAEPPDSLAWQQEAQTRGINTILVPLARYQGMTLFPQLHAFCRSNLWRPVYLDEVSAIFVLRSPQTESLIERLQVDCDKISFALPPDLNAVRSTRARADLFNALANAGGILYSLERYPEALSYLDQAQSVFPDNGNLHLLRALVLQQLRRATEAEAEFHTSLALEPDDETWFDLGLFYMTQRRYADAAQVFRESATTSLRPHEMWMMLGQAELQMRNPEPALTAFDNAEESSPFSEGGEALGAGFHSLIATGRAKAWYQLGDVAKAVSFQEDAVQLVPNDTKLWLGLADLYEAQGRTTKAAEARAHAMQH